MRNRLIEQWMLLLLVMLLTACHSDDKEEIINPDEDCYLDIYVYAPDHPIVTRADVGNIKARKEEFDVHSLQIWVFKSSTGDLVGYLNAGEDGIPIRLNETNQQVFRMKVEKSFANTPEAVDVYVVANAASFGNAVYVPDGEGYTSTTLAGNTTRAKLNNALFGKIDNDDYFGTTNLYGIADLASGLPMSAVLKNQAIVGKFPTLRIGTESQIATLHLTRAVSKLRFVLCRIKEQSSSSTKTLTSINSIKLNGNMIPEKTYLMPGTYNYSSYVSGDITFEDGDFVNHKLMPDKIPQVVNPLVYTYETQTAQDYENLIDAAVERDLDKLKAYGQAKNIDEVKNLTADDLLQLKQLGLTYLRESDKQLAGTISYTYNDNGTPQTEEVTFSMAAAGDFLRNHSWIVYIYYMDSKIYTLTVTYVGMKEWVSDGQPESPYFYNW